jgi:hypothetical protein
MTKENQRKTLRMLLNTDAEGIEATALGIAPVQNTSALMSQNFRSVAI